MWKQRSRRLNIHQREWITRLRPIRQVGPLTVLGSEDAHGSLRQVIFDIRNTQDVLSKQSNSATTGVAPTHNEIKFVDGDVENCKRCYRGDFGVHAPTSVWNNPDDAEYERL
jgi:hypothetical protein